jgi:hypothetical protein
VLYREGGVEKDFVTTNEIVQIGASNSFRRVALVN